MELSSKMLKTAEYLGLQLQDTARLQSTTMPSGGSRRTSKTEGAGRPVAQLCVELILSGLRGYSIFGVRPCDVGLTSCMLSHVVYAELYFQTVGPLLLH